MIGLVDLVVGTVCSVFDCLLYRPATRDDIGQYDEVQRILREEIVNPLRQNCYVRSDKVMKLRRLLQKLGSVTGLTNEEKGASSCVLFSALVSKKRRLTSFDILDIQFQLVILVSTF